MKMPAKQSDGQVLMWRKACVLFFTLTCAVVKLGDEVGLDVLGVESVVGGGAEGGLEWSGRAKRGREAEAEHLI